MVACYNNRTEETFIILGTIGQSHSVRSGRLMNDMVVFVVIVHWWQNRQASSDDLQKLEG